uniref:RNA-directed DNA polymerase n=1 Tax=Strongyloides stercoralis TaxID=6248 RepID=A0A0K0E4M4_STRER
MNNPPRLNINNDSSSDSNMVIPIHKYSGKLSYYNYIKREFYLMDIEESLTPSKFIKTFLKCQSEMTKNLFFQNHPDMEAWKIEDVKEFCNQMSNEEVTHDLEAIISFQSAKRFYNESIQCYIKRLKTLLLPFKNIVDSLDVAILCKVAFEAEDELKQKLCELEHIDIDSFVRAHVKFSSGIILKNKLKGNSFKQSYNIKSESLGKPMKVASSTLNHTSKGGADTIKQMKISLPLALTTTPLIREAIRIFNKDLVVLIDSGATASILNIDTVNKFGWFYEKAKTCMEAFDGSTSHSIGLLKGAVSILNKDIHLTENFHVVEKGENTITLSIAKSLDINIYLKLEEIQNNRKNMIKKIEEINVTHPKLAQCLLDYPEVYNEDILPPKVSVTFPIFSEPDQIIHKSYPQKGKKKIFLAETLMAEIREGKISQVHSPVLSSPIHIVGNKKMRMVIDGSDVNRSIKPISIKLPSMQEMKLKMVHWEVFFRFDFSSAFKSLKVDEHTSYIQTFATQFGYYKSNVLNFGYKVSTALYVKEIERLMTEYDLNDFIVFVDDSVIGAKKEESHLLEDKICRFIKMCAENSLKLNLMKSEWNVDKIEFLGFEIDANGIRVSKKRHNELINLDKPTNAKMAKSILGKFGYISNHIENFSQSLSVLQPKDSEPYIWSAEKDKAWNDLMKNCQQYFEFVCPPEDVALYMEYLPTDGCLHAHLYFHQINKDKVNENKIVSVLMRKLSDIENRYSYIEKELLSISTMIRTEKHIVRARNITIITRSKLTFSLITSNLDDIIKENSRIQRLIGSIVAANLKIKFVATALKPNFKLKEDKLKINSIKVINYDISSNPTNVVTNDEIIYDQKMNNSLPNVSLDSNDKDDFSIINDILCYKLKPVLSESLSKAVIDRIHKNTHSGQSVLQKLISDKYTCDNLSMLVKNTVQNCDICMKARDLKKPKPISWVKPSRPREIGSFDIFFWEKETYIIFIDHYSNFTYVQKIQNKKSETIINFFTQIFSQFPFSLVISDGEISLWSDDLELFFSKQNIPLIINAKIETTHTKHWKTPMYHPSSNGKIEGRIKSIKKKLFKAQAEGIEKKDRIQWAVNALNNMPSITKDNEGKTFLTPSQKYFVNSVVNNIITPNIIECKPEMVYYKRRGKLSPFFSSGLKIGSYGTSISLIESEEGENFLISNDFILSKPELPTDNILDDNLNDDFQELFPESEDAIGDVNKSYIIDDDDILNLSSSMHNLSIQNIDESSLTSEEELQEFIKKHKNYLITDGSASNDVNVKCNTGIGIQGSLNGKFLSVGYINFLKGICTAPRAECVAVCMALLIANKEKVDDLTIITDCNYIVEAIRNLSYKEWIKEKNKSKTPHFKTWCTIAKLIPKIRNLSVKHIMGHKAKSHNEVDLLAKGLRIGISNDEYINLLSKL